MDRKIIQNLAKTELHCHLDGSISLKTIRCLAAMANRDLPQSDDDLKRLVTAPKDSKSLMDYLKTFDYIRPLLQTKEALSLAAYDVAKQASQENVIYIEVRFAPELSMDEGLSASEVVLAVLAGLQQAGDEFGIVAKGLVCGMRQSPPSLTQELFREIARLSEAGLVGFDFAGNEHDFPPSDLVDLIRYTQSLGRPMTLHAGECGCPHYISEAVELGIKRLGHVTAIHHQPAILAEVVKHQVTAELCLTSNLQTKAIGRIDDFPYLELKAAGAKITINTDNRTVSDTNLSKEYALFVKHFGVTIADFLAYNQNAIEAAFAAPDEKKDLLLKLEKAYETYLK